jgi:hypothetical protein
VWVYRQPNGETSFQPGVAVAHSTGSDVYHYPSLVADAEGVLHLTWAFQRGSQWDIFYSQSTDGGETFSTPLQVNQP